MGQVLNLNLNGTVEERTDRWVIKCRALGVLVYGKTFDEVQKHFGGAVQALIDSFYGDEAELITWLNRKEVTYKLSQGGTEWSRI